MLEFSKRESVHVSVSASCVCVIVLGHLINHHYLY